MSIPRNLPLDSGSFIGLDIMLHTHRLDKPSELIFLGDGLDSVVYASKMETAISLAQEKIADVFKKKNMIPMLAQETFYVEYSLRIIKNNFFVARNLYAPVDPVLPECNQRFHAWHHVEYKGNNSQITVDECRTCGILCEIDNDGLLNVWGRGPILGHGGWRKVRYLPARNRPQVGKNA